MKKTIVISTMAIASFLFVNKSFAQTEGDMAKAAQNPVANMYSFPLQYNTVYGVGPYNRNQNILNIQPVIPIPIGKKMNMINRIILPVITQPSFTEDASSTGIGDINYTAWLSPSKDSKLIWGAGAAFQLPTASSPTFGSGEFGVGPSVVLLSMPGDFVIGAVINNVTTFGDQAENKFFMNYFVNYNFPKWYLVTAPIVTANWNAADGQKWVVPFGGGAGKVFKLGGKLPMNVNAHVYYNVVKPTGVGDWQSRVQLVVMIPTKAMKEKMQATAN